MEIRPCESSCCPSAPLTRSRKNAMCLSLRLAVGRTLRTSASNSSSGKTESVLVNHPHTTTPSARPGLKRAGIVNLPLSSSLGRCVPYPTKARSRSESTGSASVTRHLLGSRPIELLAIPTVPHNAPHTRLATHIAPPSGINTGQERICTRDTSAWAGTIDPNRPYERNNCGPCGSRSLTRQRRQSAWVDVGQQGGAWWGDGKGPGNKVGGVSAVALTPPGVSGDWCQGSCSKRRRKRFSIRDESLSPSDDRAE